MSLRTEEPYRARNHLDVQHGAEERQKVIIAFLLGEAQKFREAAVHGHGDYNFTDCKGGQRALEAAAKKIAERWPGGDR